jgi:hypothetical protein
MSFPVQGTIANCSTTDNCLNLYNYYLFFHSSGEKETSVKKVLFRMTKAIISFGLNKEHSWSQSAAHYCKDPKDPIKLRPRKKHPRVNFSTCKKEVCVCVCVCVMSHAHENVFGNLEYWNDTSRKVFISVICLVQDPGADCSTTDSCVHLTQLSPFSVLTVLEGQRERYQWRRCCCKRWRLSSTLC